MAAPPPAFLDVTWEGPALLTGRIARLEVRSTYSSITTLHGALDARKLITFSSSADGKTWTALGAVNVEAKAQPVRLALTATLADGQAIDFGKPIAVTAAPYDERKLTVSKKFVKPNRAQRKRAAREAAALRKALAGASPDRLWRGSFAQPTAGVETSPFGTRRTYNNKKNSRHLGLDLDGAVGAPVTAANRGRIVLASERFYSGGTVVVDHGEGLFTMYFHMSRLDVKPGALVDKGQGLGAVGATGQVTGPHLHFSVKLLGLYQDPHYVLALDLSDDMLDVAPSGDAGTPMPLDARVDAGVLNATPKPTPAAEQLP
jgi:murein DD-endopeptidase MepM/ murein hydrolase activator NlpD